MKFTLLNYLTNNQKRIFLFSHMRSCSSLLSHIIGSNVEISGYYEMHQHYFSKKSLFKQKLKHMHNERFDVKSSNYIYDKLLHNSLHISKNILLNENHYFIIMLRNPELTLPSLVEMGRKKGKKSPFNKLEYCENYYLDRIKALQRFSTLLKGRFFYINADDLIKNSESILTDLTKFIGLKIPLSEEYKSMNNTGKPSFGDTSVNIGAGKILKDRPINKTNINCKESLNAYLQLNEELKNLCCNSSNN